MLKPRWRGIHVILVTLTLLFGASVSFAEKAFAACSGTHCDAQGTQELSGADWLGGNGVPIYANHGSAAYDSGVDNVTTTPDDRQVTSGEEWQCVEMINRLYLSKGWITSRWTGNGGQFYDTAPSGLTKQLNGSITDLKAGDVVVLQDKSYGHVGVINSVSDTSVSIANQNTAAVYSSATFKSGKLTMVGWASYTVKGVVHAPQASLSTPAPPPPPPAQPDLLLARVGTTLYSKVNIGDEWATQTTGATGVKAVGGRIGITDTSGNLDAKDGPNGSWVAETGAIDQYVVTPNLLVIRVGGTVYAKAQLTDQWSTEVGGGATSIQAVDNTMAFVDSNGTLWAKIGVNGEWQQEIGNVSQFVLTSSLLLARVGNTLYSKTNIGGEWTAQTDAATDVKASGGRIVITATDGTVYAKDGPNGAWYAETGATDQIVVTPNLLIVRVGGTVYAKAQLYDAWSTVVGGSATDVQAANNTMAFIDGDGTLWAKVGVSGTWLQEIGNVSQVVVS